MLMATLELWDIELGDYVVGHMIRKLICDNDSGAQELSIDAGQYEVVGYVRQLYGSTMVMECPCIDRCGFDRGIDYTSTGVLSTKGCAYDTMRAVCMIR
jgi:hypothetical protein